MRRRRRYEFKMTLTTTFLAYPNRVMAEHDKLARQVMNAIQVELGRASGTVRDCKTGRFRSIKSLGRR